jgi:hypothetical protein
MSSKFRNVALLLPAFVLATGLASAQPGVKVSTVNSNGTVATTTISSDTSGGPGAKAPVFSNPLQPGPGYFPYWDVPYPAGASTNYAGSYTAITETPSPQIATGPDDILMIVNRAISRYPNPNASGNTGPTNPYLYLPTELVTLDVWLGLNLLGGNPSSTALCPSGTSLNTTCVIDNASIRYDQMQGRFVVLFTVTDLPAHRSNWVLIVSNFAQFRNCTNTPAACIGGPGSNSSSPFFTSPAIAPIVGGIGTGGVNSGTTGNWTAYPIPINLLYNQFQQPSALGLVNNPAAPAPFNNVLANSAVGTPNAIGTGGSTGVNFLTVPFCTNGGPTLTATGTLTYASVNGQALGAGGTGRSCTNYFPTGARFGLDNDNIILTAPVLDQAFAPNECTPTNSQCFPAAPPAGTTTTRGQGPYAGTRVTTIPKLVVYNGSVLGFTQPPSCLPATCQAVNLADNTATGTLTAVTTKVAFGQGTVGGAGVPNGDLQYAAGKPTTPNSCITAVPLVVNSLTSTTGAAPTFPPALSCAPIAGLTNALPAIFWEPDNLRGRTFATFDSQVSSFGLGNVQSQFSGVLTPIDYLVGTQITDNFGGPGSGVCAANPGCSGLIPQGTPGVTGQPASLLTPPIVPLTSGIATIYYLEPIVFSCPSGVLLAESVSFCGTGVNGPETLVSDLPLFGVLTSNVSTLAQVADPAPVGQGFSATQMTTSPANVPVTSTTNSRLFVGDSRPLQVMFREGLLYVARTVRLADSNPAVNWLGTATELYDIIKTCSTGTGPVACGGAANGYSVTGANLTAANLAFEYEWFNGLSVPDPSGDINGFGFYQPMFDVPADVVATGPVPPISALQLFDKLFVGMTTGGTTNTAGIFSRDFPSLWDFRPGDDAYDTQEPYLDPYTGNVASTYACGNNVNVTITAASGSTITVADPTGLGVGMFLSGSTTVPPQSITGILGNVVTLSSAFTGKTFPTGATFTRVQPTVSTTATLVVPGSNQITVSSTTGLLVGQILGSGNVKPTAYVCNLVANAGTPTNPPYQAITCPPGVPTSPNSFGISSLTNVGLGEVVTGQAGSGISTNLTIGNQTFVVPQSTQIAVGETVTGTGIPAGSKVLATYLVGATVTPGIFMNQDGTLTVAITNPATINGPSSVTFDSTPCFSAGGPNFVESTTNASAFIVKGANVPGVSIGATNALATTAVSCTSYYADGAIGSSTGQTAASLSTILLGAIVNNGIQSTFTATVGSGTAFFPTGTTILQISGSTLTLSNPASTPLPGGPFIGGGTTSTNLPFNFTTAGSAAVTTCPIIPFSTRGGASTDPNDGSLWLAGEFAKNRLSTLGPGGGQWGISIANYALSFPATDAYGNDNTYFQDVQPLGSANADPVNSPFFTWIQLAKNINLAVPAATGPCTINNGVTPVQQPPVSGGTATPSPSTLLCPYFQPATLVTRAEMSYWVVRAQMDEAQISNYLCATGGDPTGLATGCNGGGAVATFGDLAGLTVPFAGPSAALASLGQPGFTAANFVRYIEVMARRGYSKGCASTFDVQLQFCPNANVTRAQMAAFIIRAKMSNVFPTVLSGSTTIGPYGDAFNAYQAFGPYFIDEPASDPFFPFIQKMRELRITNGTGGSSFSPNNSLTRREIATFIVRAFFL